MPLHRDITRLRGVNITGDMKIDGNEVETAVLLGSGEVIDVNGEADAIVLDADADTTISAPTDDQIDFELKSVDHVVMKAAAVADAGTITNIVEIAATSPVDTTGTNTHNALNIDLEIGNATGGTNEVRGIAIDNITGDAQVTATGILLGTGFDIGLDMAGTKLELDADNDTSIIASTDDTIQIEISGAVDFTLTANKLTANTGSVIETDTISEVTAANGVDIDGLKVKDNSLLAWKTATESVGVNTAPSAADSGKTYFATAANLVFTLPSTVLGLRYRFVVTAAALSVGTGLSVSPAAADKIMGNGFTSQDNKDAINTGASDREGDFIEVTGDGVDGWYITAISGTWAREA